MNCWMIWIAIYLKQLVVYNNNLAPQKTVQEEIFQRIGTLAEKEVLETKKPRGRPPSKRKQQTISSSEEEDKCEFKEVYVHLPSFEKTPQKVIDTKTVNLFY